MDSGAASSTRTNSTSNWPLIACHWLGQAVVPASETS